MGKKILFICLGNICRSPAAEGIMKQKLLDRGIASGITCDSAGTSGYHNGASPDSRMIDHAAKRGYLLDSFSRLLLPRDLKDFDYLVVMDKKNLRDVKALDKKGEYSQKMIPITRFCRANDEDEVPDPYYDGALGFEKVLDILEDACTHFLEWVLAQNKDKDKDKEELGNKL